MAVTTTTVAYALKRIYSKRAVENLVYKDNPLLALIPKKSGFTGSAKGFAVRFGDGQARSATFSSAQSQVQGTANGQGNNTGVQFLLTRVKDYQLWQIETEAMMATQDDMGAFLSMMTGEVNSALNNAGRSVAHALYGDGSGARGQRASASTNVITLSNVNDVVNFEVGMGIEAAATLTGAKRSGSTYVTAVDRDAGTVTLNSAAAITSFADNDYLFNIGDSANAGGTPLRISGLEAWNPSSAPSSTAFFGVDRSVDVARLGGLRIDVSTLNPEEGLVTAIHRLAREGGSPDYLFENPLDVKNIHLALGSKAVTEYTQVGDIGFGTIRVTGPKGDVRVVADFNAPSAVGRLLTLNTWELSHMGELFNVLDQDGARVSRVYNSDAFEGRIAFYGNLGCYGPGRNARLVLPS